MKITGSESIKASEKEFIDTINAELDWGALESVLLERHNFQLRDDVEYKGGDLVVHGAGIAYKLDFEIKLSLSVIVDRNGDCLEITSSADRGGQEDDLPNPAAGGTPSSDLSTMASSLAEMISDINRGGDG